MRVTGHRHRTMFRCGKWRLQVTVKIGSTTERQRWRSRIRMSNFIVVVCRHRLVVLQSTIGLDEPARGLAIGSARQPLSATLCETHYSANDQSLKGNNAGGNKYHERLYICDENRRKEAWIMPTCDRACDAANDGGR